MMYDIMVTIHNSPNKAIGWGYLIEADTKEEAVKDALDLHKQRQTSRIQDLSGVLLVWKIRM